VGDVVVVLLEEANYYFDPTHCSVGSAEGTLRYS